MCRQIVDRIRTHSYRLLVSNAEGACKTTRDSDFANPGLIRGNNDCKTAYSCNVSPTSPPTTKPTTKPTNPPTNPPTTKPTSPPTTKPTGPNVPYTFVTTPPVFVGGWTGGSYSHTHLQDPCGTAFWIAPHPPSEHMAGGDPTFYLHLDLGSSIPVDKLRVRNLNWNNDDAYCTRSYEVSVSDSQDSGYGTPIIGTLLTVETFTQDITIGQTGRYIKFKGLTYCINSMGLRYLEVLAVCVKVVLWSL